MRGYKPYRGKGTSNRGKGVLHRLLVIFLLLILLASLAFLAFERYIVYEPGNKFYFDLPFTLPWEREEVQQSEQTEQPSLPPVEEKPVQIIVEPPPKEQTNRLRLCMLPEQALTGEVTDLTAQLQRYDANGFVLQIKDIYGTLHYPTKIAEVMEFISETPMNDALIDELIDSSFYTVARFPALHDSAFALKHIVDSAICRYRREGENYTWVWYDSQNSHWLEPGKTLTRQYVATLVDECAARGFNEILLEDFCYPTRGNLAKIDDRNWAMEKKDALLLLASEVKNTLVPYNVRLSVLLDAETIRSGSDAAKGQYVAELATYFDQFYVETTVEELPELEAAIAGLPVRIVPILQEVPQEGLYCVAAENFDMTESSSDDITGVA